MNSAFTNYIITCRIVSHQSRSTCRGQDVVKIPFWGGDASGAHENDLNLSLDLIHGLKEKKGKLLRSVVIPFKTKKN